MQIELARNMFGHFILFFLYYLFLTALARSLAIITCIGFGVSRLLFLVAGWILSVAGNELLFPLSSYAPLFRFLAQPAIVIGLLGLLALTAILALWRIRYRMKPWIVGAGTLGLAGTIAGASLHVGMDNDRPIPQPRNIIVIGVDSLSNNIMNSYRLQMPNTAGLLEKGIAFNQAYTPLGRTFPAWVSLLSGQSPAEHGAIFNLRNMEHVKRAALLPHTLRNQGYQTVFAIDERRFANIDESFGFDRIVGPKAGVLDFVLQKANDTPLTNLLLQTPLGRHVLPFSYINTASFVNYDADAFVKETVAATAGARKLFLAVHFESAHFPFMTRHAEQEIVHPNIFISRHVTALAAVDQQVGALMSGLAAGGHLDDALVIVLSDHGEGFGESEAQTTQDGVPFNTGDSYGHGVSVLSEHQNKIILGLIRYKNGQPSTAPSRNDELVSLTDIRPAIERFATEGKMDLIPSNPCLFVETGIRFFAAANYQTLNPAKLAQESAKFYEIDSSGRMRLREETLSALINTKDVGLRCKDRITYYMPQAKRYFAYRLSDSSQNFLEIEPGKDDVLKIEKYRKLYATSAP